VQTTLLGLGIAIILALVTALVGPHFVDWTQYRSVFESNASRLAGMPVKVNGKIDVRLLPTPSVVLRDIAAGDKQGEPLIKASELSIELALGPLMRGDWRAAELRIVKPEFEIALDGGGHIVWPGGAPTINPDKLSIDRLSIEDGRAVIADQASGATRVLNDFWFNGDLRSLLGPYKGEGGFIANGDRYGYRLATGRLSEDGIRVRLGLDPDWATSIDTDGMLRFEDGAPRFEGALTLARPASTTTGNAPWRATARVKGTPAGVLFDRVEVQYGPDDRAIKLTGTAELKLGKTPRLDGVVSARQIDLDRMLGLPEAARRLPLAVARAFADAFGGALRPSIPIRIGIGVDSMNVAGASLQNLRGDLASDGDAGNGTNGGSWDLQTLEFRAPGYTQVRLSGRFALGAQGMNFTGPAAVEAADPKALLAWLEGRDAAAATQAGPLRVNGEVTLGADKVAVERLKAEFDRKTIEGRIAYAWATAGRPPRLDADLTAPELDVDGTLAFARAALAGTSVDMPGEVTLALDVGLATVAGIDVKGTKAKLKLDANALVLERASIADLGGAAVDASGRIDGLKRSPRGTLTLDIDARALDGVTAILAKFAPWAADSLRRAAPQLTPAKLRTTLTVMSGASGDTARLLVNGKAGAARVVVNAAATGDVSALAAVDITFNGRIEADKGAALATLLGLDRSFNVDQRPGVLTLTAVGPFGGDVKFDGSLKAGGFDFVAGGWLYPSGKESLGRIDATLAAADVRLPSGTGQPGTGVPVKINASLDLGRETITLDHIVGTVGASPLRGKLTVTPGQPVRVDGGLETDSVDAAALIVAAGGAPSKGGRDALSAWTSEPFGRGAFADLTGQIEVKAARAAFSPTFVARQLRTLVRLGEETSFNEVDASIAGGRITGEIALRGSADGLGTRFKLKLANADMATLLPGETQPPITGHVTVQLEAEGTGLSPAALIGALRGTGAVTVEQAQLAGLDPRAFAAVTRAVDQGLAIDAAKIKDTIVAGLDIGRLIVPRAEGTLALVNGQVRWGDVLAAGDGADVKIGGSLDLSDWLLDARLTLSGPAEGQGAAVRPDILVSLRGAPTAPQRNVDVSALVGWLMLRAVERESQRLDTLQNERTEINPTNPEVAPTLRPAPSIVRTAPPPEAPAERPRPRATTPPPAPQKTGPRSAAVPPTEIAPDLAPPMEIRPLPAHRKTTAKTGTSTKQPPAAPTPIPEPSPAPGRSFLDPLFGPPQR
jgi:large subunit ribosomal protein L24